MDHSNNGNKTDLERSRDKLITFLRQRNMRRTPERFALLECVMEQTSHFSVDEFHRRIEARGGFHVSKATVYNTIQLFLEAGIVRRHTFDGTAQYERIEIDGHNHHHLVCTRCGTVREAGDDTIAEVIGQHKYKDFEPSYFSLYVYGLCPRCRRKQQ